MSLKDKLKGKMPNKEWDRKPEILLCPNVPKPLAGVNPRTILGRKWWDKTRKEAYISTNFHCIACGVHKEEAKGPKWLEGHEVYEANYPKGRMSYVETVPLCHYCHNFIHDGRMLSLLGAGKYDHGKYVRVMNHGNKVLREAGLVKIPYSGEVAPWSKWRLELLGKKYKPLFKSYEEWMEHYNLQPAAGVDIYEFMLKGMD